MNAGKTDKFEVTEGTGAPGPRSPRRSPSPASTPSARTRAATIKPQSLIGEYYVDCQPGDAQGEARRTAATIPVKQTTSTMPAGPGQQHHAPPLPRAPAADHRRARHRPGRPPGGPARVLRRPTRACARPPRRCRSSATRTRSSRTSSRDSDTVVASSRTTSRTWPLDRGGRRHRRDHGHPPRGSCGQLQQLPALPRRAEAHDGAPGRADRRAEPAARGPAARRAGASTTFFTRLGPFAEASRPAVRSLGKASEKGTAGVQARAATRSTSCASSRRDAPPTAKPLRQFLQTLDDRSRAHRRRPARQGGAAPAGDRPTATATDGRLHRHGVASELLLLADPGAQRVRRPQPRAARERRSRPATVHACSRHRRGARTRARAKLDEVQRVARPEPARHDHARLHRGAARPRQLRARGRASRRQGGRAPRRRASPRPARSRASTTSPSRRSRCRPASRTCSTRCRKLPERERDPQAPRRPLTAAGEPKTSDRRTSDPGRQLLDYLLAP